MRLVGKGTSAIPGVVQQRAAAGRHILLVDMYTPFNPDQASLLEDQWHPSLAGYGGWYCFAVRP